MNSASFLRRARALFSGPLTTSQLRELWLAAAPYGEEWSAIRAALTWRDADGRGAYDMAHERMEDDSHIAAGDGSDAIAFETACERAIEEDRREPGRVTNITEPFATEET